MASDKAAEAKAASASGAGKDLPNGSKVFSEPDPTLSVAEREAAEAEEKAAAEKEEAQEVEARDAKARFLGIAPLVGVEDAPEPVLQDGGPSNSPVGLSKDHREKAAGKKAPAKKAAPKKAAAKKAAPKAAPAGTGKLDETMPGAPDSATVGLGDAPGG